MPNNEIFICPHTHWDREWYKPFEEYRSQLLELMKKVLYYLEHSTNTFKFTFYGQSIILEDVLLIYPNYKNQIQQAVAKKLILFGPWYTQPDQNLVSGESLIRNIQFGIKLATEYTGDYLKIGYEPYMIGHISQLGQIFSIFSIDHLFMWRGVPPSINASEFYWINPSGLKTLVTNLYESYSDGVFLPSTFGDFEKEILSIVNRRKDKQISNAILIMNGTDHTFPQLELSELINKTTISGLSIKITTFQEYSNQIKKELNHTKRLQEITGELRDSTNAPVLTGVYSTRLYLKQLNAQIQRLYEDYLYPLQCVFVDNSKSHFLTEIEYGMKLLLQAHSHDCICGCSIDQVHSEMIVRLNRSNQSGKSVLNKLLQHIKSTLVQDSNTGNNISQTLVLHPHNFVFKGMLPITIELEDFTSFDTFKQTIVLANEKNVLFDLVAPKTETFILKDYGISSIHFNRIREMIAHMVDSNFVPVDFVLHKSIYPPELHVTFSQSASKSFISYENLTSELQQVTLPDNTMFRVVFKSKLMLTGLIWCTLQPYSLNSFTIKNIQDNKYENNTSNCLINENVSIFVDKSGIFLRDSGHKRITPFLSLVDEPDTGDEYNFSPLSDQDLLAEYQSSKLLENNSIFSAYLVTYSINIPPSLANDRFSRAENSLHHIIEIQLTFLKLQRQINLKIMFTNQSKDHRLRLRLSLPYSNTKFFTATPFHVLERPLNLSKEVHMTENQVEATPTTHPQAEFSTLVFPDQYFTMSLINDGLPEVESQYIDNQTSLLVTLVRSIGWLSRNDLVTRKGHAGTELVTPDAQCLGPHECNLSIIFTDKPNWSEIYSLAKSFLSPPLSVIIPLISSSNLQKSFGGIIPLNFDSSVIVTGYDYSESGIVIRGVNYSDEPAKVIINNAICSKVTPVGALIENISSSTPYILMKPWEIFNIRIENKSLI